MPPTKVSDLNDLLTDPRPPATGIKGLAASALAAGGPGRVPVKSKSVRLQTELYAAAIQEASAEYGAQ